VQNASIKSNSARRRRLQREGGVTAAIASKYQNAG
jgi:hypothetical protein